MSIIEVSGLTPLTPGQVLAFGVTQAEWAISNQCNTMWYEMLLAKKRIARLRSEIARRASER